MVEVLRICYNNDQSLVSFSEVIGVKEYDVYVAQNIRCSTQLRQHLSAQYILGCVRSAHVVNSKI